MSRYETIEEVKDVKSVEFVQDTKTDTPYMFLKRKTRANNIRNDKIELTGYSIDLIVEYFNKKAY